MRRDLVSLFLIAVPLAALAGFAWLTRHPEAGVLTAAREWPVVGEWAASFQDRFATSTVSGMPREKRGGTGVVVVKGGRGAVGGPAPEVIGARPQVWITPGTPIYGQPDGAVEARERAESYANRTVLERRGDWYRIRVGPPEGVEREGGERWVHLPDYRDPPRGEAAASEPVLPLPATTPDPGAVASARSLMGSGVQDGWCGPYGLVTDRADEDFLGLCDRLASSLDEVFARRYGLEPVGPPAEVILLFRSRAAFDAFRATRSTAGARHAFAEPARGIVALHGEGESRVRLLSILAHELAHLQSRRFLGPALPLWLAEGLAEDLSEGVLPTGEIVPGALGGEERRVDHRIVRTGAIAAARRLRDWLEAGSLTPLEELVRLDERPFLAQSEMHYAQSASLVRFLLAEAGRARGFRSFLAAVAKGGPADGDAVFDHLDTSWPSLQASFEVWVRLRQLREKPGTRY